MAALVGDTSDGPVATGATTTTTHNNDNDNDNDSDSSSDTSGRGGCRTLST